LEESNLFLGIHRRIVRRLFRTPKDADFANIYIVSCLGFLFSLAWYLVNRGSGAWQRNWESHVDLLVEEPYACSPSRINNLLALGVTIAWMILIVRTLFKTNVFQPPHSGTIMVMSLFTIVGAVALCWKGHSRKTDDLISIERRVRKYR
jgi:hypothetical protein